MAGLALQIKIIFTVFSLGDIFSVKFLSVQPAARPAFLVFAETQNNKSRIKGSSRRFYPKNFWACGVLFFVYFFFR